MLEAVERETAGDNVEEMTAPAAAALVGSEAVEDGQVGGLLEIEIEGSVDLEAGSMDFFRTEPTVELAADFFDEPGRDRIGRGLDVEAERGGTSGFCLGNGDLAVLKHGIDDEIAAAERSLGAEQGREFDGSFGQSGEKRGFGQG